MGPGWRRVRAAVGASLLVLSLAIVLGLSVLTRFPEAPIVERAQDWPLIGAVARAFRDRYVGAPPVERPGETPGEPEVVVITGEAREQVWVAEGTVLRAAPREDAEALGTIPAMVNVALIERRGRWAWVDYRGALGWVMPLVVSGEPGLGSRPSPVLPVPARPPDEQLLSRGLRSFSRAPTEHALGDYRLFASGPNPELLARCRDLESRLEDTYRRTFGLSPLGVSAGVILLYPTRTSYETFWQMTGGDPIAAVGRADRGVVATFVGERSAEEVCATIVHELTHLLNKRAIGPALPPWLEEGTATVVAADLAGRALDSGVARLAEHRGTLPELTEFLALDREAFQERPLRRLHYELSGLWVRFLLVDPVLGDRLRSFLKYVSEGGPYAPALELEFLRSERETPTLADDLVAFLGSGADELNQRFRIWLESRPSDPG
jgi:hypothetical protein